MLCDAMSSDVGPCHLRPYRSAMVPNPTEPKPQGVQVVDQPTSVANHSCWVLLHLVVGLRRFDTVSTRTSGRMSMQHCRPHAARPPRLRMSRATKVYWSCQTTPPLRGWPTAPSSCRPPTLLLPRDPPTSSRFASLSGCWHSRSAAGSRPRRGSQAPSRSAWSVYAPPGGSEGIAVRPTVRSPRMPGIPGSSRAAQRFGPLWRPGLAVPPFAPVSPALGWTWLLPGRRNIQGPNPGLLGIFCLF